MEGLLYIRHPMNVTLHFSQYEIISGRKGATKTFLWDFTNKE